MLDSKAQSEQGYVAMCFFIGRKYVGGRKMTKMLIFHPQLFHRPQRGFYTKEIYQESLEWKIGKEILYPLGFPNTKFKERWSKSWKWKNRKDSYAAWITYLLFSKWFRSFLQIIGRAHPHNSWNNKHKRPRNPTLGGQTDLISAFWSIYFEHHPHNFYNRNSLILKL